MNLIKELTRNDTGETGSNQEGITIPKVTKLLKYFPLLDSNIKNPRTEVNFLDDDNKIWTFGFVYYNNKFFSGTRNEYRLSKTKAYLKKNNLKAKDKIIFYLNKNNVRMISYEKKKNNIYNKDNVIVLSGKWYEGKI